MVIQGSAKMAGNSHHATLWRVFLKQKVRGQICS